MLRAWAAATIAWASGCSERASAAATKASNVVSSKSAGGDDVGEFGVALGEGAGLVEDQHVELVGGLERLGGADEHAGLGALAGGDHDRQRRGDPQRAWAGDDQHCDGRHQRELECRCGADIEPHHEGGNGDEQHSRHEPASDCVGQPLYGCLGGLGLADQPDDLGEHRVAADLGGPHPERAGLVQSRADHDIAGRFGHRHRLAGHHRLVHTGAPVEDLAVDWHLLAGTHQDDVARHDVLHGNLHGGAVALDPGGPRLQADEASDGFAGAGLGACFEETAEQDQGDDHPDRLEVHVAHVRRHNTGGNGDDRAVTERGDRAKGDQAVHVGRPMGQRQPAGAVDRPTHPPHHRRDQSELQPVVHQHHRDPPEPKHLTTHHREQHRESQRRADQQPPRQADDFGTPRRRLDILASIRSDQLVVVPNRAVVGRIGWFAFDQHRAVDHVHPTGEPVRPGTGRRELDRRLRERGQEATQRQIGEHHPRRAITILLAIEHDPQRQTGPSADHIGAVAAPHHHSHLLHPGLLDRLNGRARPKEESGQHRDSEPADKRDNDLRCTHGDNLLRPSGHTNHCAP